MNLKSNTSYGLGKAIFGLIFSAFLYLVTIILMSVISDSLPFTKNIVYVIQFILSMIFVFAWVTALGKFVFNKTSKDLYLKPSSAKSILFGIVFGVLLIGIVFLLSSIFGNVNLDKTETYSAFKIFAFILVAGFLPGIAEEVVFRGLMYNILSSKVRYKIIAMIVPALIFALMHMNNAPTVRDKIFIICGGTGVSILFTALMLATKSIFPGAIIHAIWDICVSDNILTIVLGTQRYSYKIEPTSFLLDGGNMGIQASPVIILLYLGLAALLLIYVKKRDGKIA